MYNVALEILNILECNGYKTYIVGGFVRNKLLGIINNDIDIITSAKPIEIRNIFNIHNKDNYGSIKLLYKGFKFDITTFRKESNYLDNRWPINIEYVTTLEEDLKRRDFTINSICIDKDGNYIDLLDGISDLNNKLIRCIGNCSLKLKEDSLRILRAIRFASIYNMKLSNELEESIRQNSSLIRNLSFDRIKSELNLIFSSFNCNYGISIINDLGLSEILEIELKNTIIPTGNYLSVWSQINYSNKYNFSNKEKKIINEIRSILKIGYIDEYILYNYDFSNVEEAACILKIDDDLYNIYNNLVIHCKSDIDITYDELTNLVSNVNINDIYVDLEKQILYNKLKNKKDFIISYINYKYKEGEKNE
ncbi:MAG: hypothetical protein J6J17_00975 [Bacilli bacterium]|nr:hypothetical protein [Bacilli bacterium]